MPKICLVSHSFLPTIGGAELAVHHLAKTLIMMGEEVVVFTPRKKLSRKFITNYKIEYYPRMPRGYLQGQVFAIFLIYLQKKYNFDIIHIHKAQMGYYATKIKKLLKVPIIITTHGGDIQRFSEINYGDRLDPVWNSRIEYAVKNADLLTAIGTSTRRDYLDIGVCEDRIVDIPNGVDLKRFSEKSEDIRTILELSGNIKFLLSVGRYHIKKGYEYLVEAMPFIVKQYKEVRCLIIGRKLGILKPLIKKLGIEEYVILLDQQSYNRSKDNAKLDFSKLPNDILLSAYKSSDIYVSSSLIEGFALVLVEAMAAGLPIVATDVPGNEDAVVDGENGFLVPSKDSKALAEKIIILIHNENLRTNFGERSRDMAKKYDWKLIAHKYLDSYKGLLSI